MDLPISRLPVVMQSYHLPYFGVKPIKKETYFIRHLFTPSEDGYPILRVNDLRYPVGLLGFDEPWDPTDKVRSRKMISAINSPAFLTIKEDERKPIITLTPRDYGDKPNNYLSWFTFREDEKTVRWDIREFNPLWSSTVEFVYQNIRYWSGIILTDDSHRVAIDIYSHDGDGEKTNPYIRPYHEI